MPKISKDEIRKLARLSRLDIHEDEIAPLTKKIDDILSYAERVREIAEDIEEPSNRNINVFREDVVIKTDPEPILAQAPEREEDYFVVPVVLDDNE